MLLDGKIDQLVKVGIREFGRTPAFEPHGSPCHDQLLEIGILDRIRQYATESNADTAVRHITKLSQARHGLATWQGPSDCPGPDDGFGIDEQLVELGIPVKASPLTGRGRLY
jgi:hypothetical protein